MVNRKENKLVREIDKPNENETLAVINYVTEILSTRIRKAPENPFTDDLIRSLSEKRENQRARQVVEWEKIRRKNIQKTA